MPIDQPSEMMWCMTMHRVCSSCPVLKQQAADERAAAEVEGRARFDVDLLLAFGLSLGGGGLCEIHVAQRKAGLGFVAMICRGCPSSLMKVVRRTSWRATMLSSAACSAGRSSGPLSLRAPGMW